MNKLIRVIGLGIVGLFSTLLVANSVFANEVNVFSARHYDSDVQLYEKFTAKILIISLNFFLYNFSKNGDFYI